MIGKNIDEKGTEAKKNRKKKIIAWQEHENTLSNIWQYFFFCFGSIAQLSNYSSGKLSPQFNSIYALNYETLKRKKIEIFYSPLWLIRRKVNTSLILAVIEKKRKIDDSVLASFVMRIFFNFFFLSASLYFIDVFVSATVIIPFNWLWFS